jgi:hypothetical protein
MEKTISFRSPILLYLLATALVSMSIIYLVESVEAFTVAGAEFSEMQEGGLFLLAALGSAILAYWLFRTQTRRDRRIQYS